MFENSEIQNIDEYFTLEQFFCFSGNTILHTKMRIVCSVKSSLTLSYDFLDQQFFCFSVNTILHTKMTAKNKRQLKIICSVKSSLAVSYYFLDQNLQCIPTYELLVIRRFMLEG